MHPLSYKNYIFDLYGTLLDIHTDERKRYLWEKMSALYQSYGATYTPGELRQAYQKRISSSEKSLGLPYGEIQITPVFRALFEDKKVSTSDEMLRCIAYTFRTISRSYLRPYPGVIETLKKLKCEGKGIYLLSNAQSVFTHPEVCMTGLDHLLDGILYSSDAGIRKPDPAFMEKGLSIWGLNRSECVMVGNDAECDGGVARGSCMDCIYIFSNISPSDDLKRIDALDANERQTFVRIIRDGDFTKVRG